MVKLHELKPAPGSKKKRKRVGRGVGSGRGKTCGRGMNGQNSRSGGGTRPGFEGGQTPLHRRMPKRGFKNPFSTEFEVLNVAALNRYTEGEEITPQRLKEDGVISKIRDGIKILGDGDVQVALTVRAHAFSDSAKQKIEDAGGTAEVI